MLLRTLCVRLGYGATAGVVGLLSLGVSPGVLAQTPPGHAAPPQAEICVPPSTWLVPGTKTILSTPALVSRMAGNRVVLLGEFHDDEDHHRWQLHTLAALYAARPDLSMGVEMLPRAVQSVLDRWVAGQLSESEFLKEVRWGDYWSFDPALYMPLFHFARINHIPIYALNVDKKLIRKIGEQGWASIPQAEREGVTDPAPASEDYISLLAGSFQMHGKPHQNGAPSADDVRKNPAFLRFVESQQLWDRAMAQVIAEAAQRKNPPLVVGIMGSGHMMNDFGVPEQLAAMGIKDVAVLIPWDNQIDCAELTANFADAVFGLPEVKEAADNKPRLGVAIEPNDSGVSVTQVTADSIAQLAGIEAGDVIVEIAGLVKPKVSDVVDAVQHMEPGTWLPIAIKRAGKQIEVIAKFPRNVAATAMK